MGTKRTELDGNGNDIDNSRVSNGCGRRSTGLGDRRKRRRIVYLGKEERTPLECEQ